MDLKSARAGLIPASASTFESPVDQGLRGFLCLRFDDQFRNFLDQFRNWLFSVGGLFFAGGRFIWLHSFGPLAAKEVGEPIRIK